MTIDTAYRRAWGAPFPALLALFAVAALWAAAEEPLPPAGNPAPAPADASAGERPPAADLPGENSENPNPKFEPPPRPVRPPKVPVDPKAPPLKIAFISYANPQQVARDITGVVAYLEPLVGVRVEGSVTMDYGSSVEAMRGEKTDLAFVDPLAFMMAHEQIGARPLLLEVYAGGPRYHSCVWARKGGPVKAPADLKGRSIAFADQVDMSGHLLPREIFAREGLLKDRTLEGGFFKQAYFAGGDEQAIRAVLNGFVDAAGVSQYADLLLRPEERDQIVSVAVSFDSPSHLVMARKGLPEETARRVKDSLRSLDPGNAEDRKVLDRLYGVQGYVEASLSDFAEVAKVAAAHGFVKKPEAFAPPAAAAEKPDGEAKGETGGQNPRGQERPNR